MYGAFGIPTQEKLKEVYERQQTNGERSYKFNSIEKRTCPTCNNTFYYPAIWKKTFCSESCQRKHRRQELKALIMPKTCPICNTDFRPNRTDQKYCSNACKQKAYRQSVTDKTRYNAERR